MSAYLEDRDRLIADQDATPGGSAIDEIDLRIAEVRSAARLYGSGVEFIDSPEVDGVTYVRSGSGDLKAGSFISVKITDALEYDLIGVAA